MPFVILPPVRLFKSCNETAIIVISNIPQTTGKSRWLVVLDIDSDAGFVNIKAARPNIVIMVIINHWLYIILQRMLLDLPVPFLRIYHFTPVLRIPGKIILYKLVAAVAPNIVFVEMRQLCFFRMRRIFIDRIQKSIMVTIQTVSRNCHLADLVV